MRNWKVLTILAGSLLASGSILADELKFMSHNTYELPLVGFAAPGSGQVGELVTCEDQAAPPFQFLLRTNLIFDRFEGVCDDLSSTPCAGRLVAVREVCTGRADGNEAGLIEAVYFAGSQLRICWDESATGQCTSEYEVATGETLGGQNQVLMGASTGRSIRIDEIFKGAAFLVDGNAVKIKEGTLTSHQTFEIGSGPAGDPNNCIIRLNRTRSACGSATTAFEQD